MYWATRTTYRTPETNFITTHNKQRLKNPKTHIKYNENPRGTNGTTDRSLKTTNWTTEIIYRTPKFFSGTTRTS